MSNGSELLDSAIKVKEIPLSEILADEEFNCRGHISESDVIDLARDIKQNGLQNPILVQPWSETPGKNWRIVSGHMRYTAHQVNKAETIPCIIKEGLNETQALILNLGENLKRKQLNIIQEAKALARLKNAGLTQTDVARFLNVERPWVQVRFYVLDFPTDIQDVIATGIINQAQIHQMNSMTTEEQYEAVRRIKDARLKAGTKRIKIKLKKRAKPEDMYKAEVRDTEAINAMLDHMMENGEVGLHTRCLAWAAGNITTMQLLTDFKQYVEVEIPGKKYEIPREGLQGL